MLALFNTCLISDVLKMSSPGILTPASYRDTRLHPTSAELFENGCKQDNKLWLTWLYCPNHDEYSTEDADADLNSWLVNTRPSVVQKLDDIAWISFAIRGGNRGPKNDPDKAMELWELEETPKNIASLVRIAKESPWTARRQRRCPRWPSARRLRPGRAARPVQSASTTLTNTADGAVARVTGTLALSTAPQTAMTLSIASPVQDKPASSLI